MSRCHNRERSSGKIVRRAVLCALFAALLPMLCETPAEASILFDFNTLNGRMRNPDVSVGPIEKYMEEVYGSDITVRLGAMALKRRPVRASTRRYLGNTDNGIRHRRYMDSYLINRWDTEVLAPDLRDRIVIRFEEAPITAFELDWQIFPATEVDQFADLTILADGVQVFFEELLGEDKRFGKLGHFAFQSDKPITELQFIDGTDAPIGIDNLLATRSLGNPTRAVPEPASLIVWGGIGICVVVAARARRRRTA